MKRTLTAACILCASALVFIDCSKEEMPESGRDARTYTIYAGTGETRTANEGLGTKWEEGDAVNVFHAEAGTTAYSQNSKFVLADPESGRFETEQLNGELAEVNDWYVMYPYDQSLSSPKRQRFGAMLVGSLPSEFQTQYGNDNMKHIAGENFPMWGIAKNVSGDDIPSLGMTHLSALVEVEVTNASDKEMVVESVNLSAPEEVIGAFYIDITTELPQFSPFNEDYVSDVVRLNVIDGEPVAAGETARFYLAVKPFTAAAGETLTISVNGADKVMKMAKDVSFSSGKIKTLRYSYEEPQTPDDAGCIILSSDSRWKNATPSIEWLTEEFSPAKGTTSGYYAFNITVPRGLTAYVLAGTDQYLTMGKEDVKLSPEEKIDLVIKNVDKPRDSEKIVDHDLYREMGRPYGCEFYHHEHGNPLYGKAVIWANEGYHDETCDCKEYLSDEGKRSGVIVPIIQGRTMNEGRPVRFAQPDAVSTRSEGGDRVFVVCRDRYGRTYEAFEIDVPQNYFKSP